MALSLFSLLQSRFAPADGGLTRRDMLRASLAGAAGLFLRDHLAFGAQERKAGKIVIGAGFAGVAAAHELHTAGYEVAVLEARDATRIGGRVYSMDGFVKNKYVEAGGELIGANHAAWLAYAKYLGLKLIDIAWNPEAEVPIVLGGRRLGTAESKELWEEMSRGLSMMNDEARKVNAEEPWKSDNAKEFDRRTTADWIEKLPVSELGKQGIAIQLTAINGVQPAWQSYLGNLSMVKGGGVEKYWTETDAFHCHEGAQQLAAELSDEIGPGTFHFVKPVTAVKVTDKSVTVTVADGTKFEADDVILAIPPSTWNRIAFDPPLPVNLTPQMGSNTKYLVSVRRRFWSDAKLSHRSLGEGLVQLTWEATFGQPGEEGACLTAYAGGPTADSIIGMASEDRNKKCLEAVKQLYPDLPRSYVNARFVNWLADPYTKGSYTFPAPGQVTTLGPILTSGLGRLHFAGEHCSYAFIGYMEGALQSGLAVAKRLAQRDGVVKGMS
jgi:monoamine oxidase